MFDDNPFFNTMWTVRDKEFFWSGLKLGVCISAIFVSIIWFDGMLIIKDIKNKKNVSNKGD